MRPDPALPSTPAPVACWYLDETHRPPLGWCPAHCHGPLVYAERAGNGDQHAYCEAHGYWRRGSIQLPSLVRRLRLDEHPEAVATR